MKRLIILIYMLVMVVGIQRSHAQKMTVKDNLGNVLMEVNDEGSVGSITLPPGALLGAPGHKLYNVGGVLYWNGAVLDKMPSQTGHGGKYLTTNGTTVSWTSLTIPDGHSLDAADGSPVDALYVDNDGEVGIGTTSPGAALEVNGQVKITGGSPGADKVLSSDADGMASWQAGGFGAWQNWVDANTLYQATTDGFVTVVGLENNVSDHVQFKGSTGSSDPPIEIIIFIDFHETNGMASGIMPVRKGDYWRIDSTGMSMSVRWIPLGN